MPGSRTSIRIIIGAVVAVLVVVAAVIGLYLWLGSGEAAEAFSASDSLDSEPGSETTGDTGATEGEADVGEILLDGTWVVSLSVDSDAGVGYRILEDLPVGGPEETTGRTTEVAGSMVIDDSTVRAVGITVQLASLDSGNELRDNILRSTFLGTDEFPTATLEVAGPAEFDLPAAPGELGDFSVPAELTVHGVTQPVTVVGNGQWGETAEGEPVIEIVGSIDATLTQFGIDRPNLAGRSSHDEVVIEFKLRFTPDAVG